MVDNYTANPAAGGTVFAADDITSVFYPRCKISIGADGAAADMAATNPLPIGANTVKDGSGTVYAPLVDADGHLQIDVLSAAIPAYTEDVASANPIVGTAIMMERDDALSALTPIEGDWASFRCNADGALWVRVEGVDAVPAPLNVVGGGVEATALRVTLATDSTGVVSID